MEVCPKAIWLQYVNPMCANMIAINNSFPEIQTVGLCHSVQGTAEMLAKDLGEKVEDIEYLCVGINHMAFYQKFEKKSNDGPNEDLYPRLKASHELLNVIAEKLNASPKITSHTDRRESLVGSDFVQTTIQVGGYNPSTIIDFEIPREYGLKQTIADTLGIGGIMRGLRTIPVLLDIAKDIMEVCPNALWLQYVNPMCANMILSLIHI